jgi:hypothetical protein
MAGLGAAGCFGLGHTNASLKEYARHLGWL